MLFEDKYEPIKIELKNRKGEVFEVETLFLTSEQERAIELIMKDPNIETMTDKSYKVLEIKFGKKAQFWKQFSNDLILDVANYIRDQNKKKIRTGTG
jgi:hypothetical protein